MLAARVILSGLEPDVVCYNAAIGAYEKGQQWKQSLGFLQGMLELWSEARCDQLQRGHQSLWRRAINGSTPYAHC